MHVYYPWSRTHVLAHSLDAPTISGEVALQKRLEVHRSTTIHRWLVLLAQAKCPRYSRAGADVRLYEAS
jgi:hypothetical protein